MNPLSMSLGRQIVCGCVSVCVCVLARGTNVAVRLDKSKQIRNHKVGLSFNQVIFKCVYLDSFSFSPPLVRFSIILELI